MSVPPEPAQTLEELLVRIQSGTVRMADLAVFDAAEPWPTAYEQRLLQAFEDLRIAMQVPGAADHMVTDLQFRSSIGTVYALAPWAVLDVILPRLEEAHERLRPDSGELHQHVRSSVPAELRGCFDARINLITRVLSLGRIALWQQPGVVEAISQDVRITPGA